MGNLCPGFGQFLGDPLIKNMNELNEKLKVRLRLLRKGDGEPVFGSHILVKLFDEDTLIDDNLGDATPNEDGEIQFEVHSGMFQSADSPGELLPDLYVIVYVNGAEIYRSPVFQDRHVPSVHGTFSSDEGMVLDLGSFLIED